jgi:hypothetical protein
MRANKARKNWNKKNKTPACIQVFPNSVDQQVASKLLHYATLYLNESNSHRLYVLANFMNVDIYAICILLHTLNSIPSWRGQPVVPTNLWSRVLSIQSYTAWMHILQLCPFQTITFIDNFFTLSVNLLFSIFCEFVCEILSKNALKKSCNLLNRKKSSQPNCIMILVLNMLATGKLKNKTN